MEIVGTQPTLGLYHVPKLEFLSINPGIFRAASEELNFNACYFCTPPSCLPLAREELAKRIVFESSTHHISLIAIESAQMVRQIDDPSLILVEISLVLRLEPLPRAVSSGTTIGRSLSSPNKGNLAAAAAGYGPLLCDFVLSTWHPWPRLFPGLWQSWISAEQRDRFLPDRARCAIDQAARKISLTG